MIRVAIVGAGIGAQHLDGYRRLPERYHVRTLCDVDLERARQVAGDDPAIALEADFDRVLSDDAIDLVDICLPPHLHFEMSMAALKAGKHVVCEKPLVPSLREADLLAEQAAASGRTITPVFQYRYGPATAQLRALMDAGLTGKPYVASIETHWSRGSDYYAVPWRGTWKGEQGGAVLGHAIHNHDLLCSIFGPVARVSAMVATRVNPIETEDCAALSFEMKNGALATSSITLGAAGDTTRLRFCFENLTAESGTAPYAPAEDQWTFTARNPDDQAAIDACTATVPAGHSGFAGFFDALADALDGKGGREVTLEDGRRSLELVSAIYKSAREVQLVGLPLDAHNAYYDGWLPSSAWK
ncbi:MAG: Gfo/Idh/MocA family oxidoreductase [Pseudomonadota bacterium]